MSNNKKAPAIRFKGFNNDWEERKFSSVANLRRGLTYKPIDVRDKGVIVLRSSNINEDKFQLNEDDIYVHEKAVNIEFIEKNDILITSANGSSHLVGKHALVGKLSAKAVHGGFMLSASAKNPFFVNSLMSSSWYVKFIKTYIAGGNGAIGNLRRSDLEEQIVLVPNELEQFKIGKFFSNLDNLITLQKRRCDKLILLKKAMLEQMFPKGKKSIPEIRFKGFNDDWEERKLGEVAEIVGGGTPSTSISDYWDGNIDWYAPAEMEGQRYATNSVRKITELGLQNSSAKILPAGKTILFTSRAGIGKMAILQRSAATNQGFQSLVLDDDIEPYFIYSMSSKIKEKAEGVASGSTFLEISGKMLGKLKISIPILPEQQMIGTFFRTLDNLITLQKRKLEKLKIIKKSMLDKMFI